MKEKSQIEKNAEERQIELLSTALNEASNAGGHWLNATGKGFPKFYPKGVAVSPFNGLFMALHSDRNGCKTNLFTLYSDAKARGTSVREHEQGVPFLFYNWNKYVHRNNPEDIISRDAYLKLDEEVQKQYKGIHNREIRTLFNIDQTTLPYVDKETYDAVLQKDGSAVERGYSETDERRLHIRFNDFLLKMRDNLVPVRSDGSGMPHYETDRDAVYMPRQRNFEHYNDYVQEALRQIVSATGHQQRLAREGMVMKNGMGPSEDALKQERLIVEVASGIKMLELGLPARLSDKSLELVDYWNRELKENPNLMDALESDVNNALEVIHKAERGEKIEYATMRNRRQTSDMQEQLPKHFYVADEIRKHPNKEDKTIVIVIDPSSKSADVILPAGASPEVDNEVPGMNKARIGRALRREGIENVRFFNPDGAWGYRPDDAYFAKKQVSSGPTEELGTGDAFHTGRDACGQTGGRNRFRPDTDDPGRQEPLGAVSEARTSERVQYLSRQGGREPFFLHAQTGDGQHRQGTHGTGAQVLCTGGNTARPESGPVQQRGAGHRPEPDSACVRIQDQTRRNSVRGDHRREETAAPERHAATVAAHVAG